MRKTIKALLIVGSLGALCGGLAACAESTPINDYQKQGYVISVTYDGSGGNIMGSSGTSIVDMFNPNHYTADAEGVIHIKLREPTTRPSAGGTISVSRSGYSLVGWYQKRELVYDGEYVVDDAGNHLTEKDGTYYVVRTGSNGETIEVETIPAYTFSDPWDFDKHTVDFKIGEEKLEVSLYAAWLPEYSFEYYYEAENEETHAKEWTKFATTTFDYLVAQTIDGSDLTKITDSVFVPEWSTETGKMEHRYSNAYTFPSLANMTFKAAYLDAERQNQITRDNPFKHPGTLDYATASPIDQVQKIYVDFDEGNRYRITKAEQFADIGDPEGYYTILVDELDFNCFVDYETGGELTFESGVRWPSVLTTSIFTGKIEGEGGKSVIFKNVGAQYSSSSTTDMLYGGLFGAIGEGALIKNVAFENVVFDVKSATGRFGANFGMLAGNIEETATIENVTINGELRLWEMSVSGGEFKLNLLANGDTSGVKQSDVKLIICGAAVTFGSHEGEYRFSAIDPDTVTLAEDGSITFRATTSNTYKENQYIVINGGDKNE